MTTGVSVDSVSALLDLDEVSGTWAAGYPLANLSDLLLPSKPARVTPSSGAAAFTFVLPASAPVNFVALVAHTLPKGSRIRIRLYSDGAMTTQVADSGVMQTWPGLSAPVSGYVSVRPWIRNGSSAIRAGRVDLLDLSGPVQIGALEVASFWEWPGLSPGSDYGFTVRGADIDLIGGGAEPNPGFQGRALSGQIDYLSLDIASTTGLDFQRSMSQSKPFLYVQESDDPETWARGIMLCKNTEVPPSVGALYRHDQFQFRFTEHWR